MTAKKAYLVELFLQAPTTSYSLLTQVDSDTEIEALDKIFKVTREEHRTLKGAKIEEVE